MYRNEDIQGAAYEKLLTRLLSCCDTVQCVTRDEDDAFFEPIMEALVDRRYVTAWPITKLGTNAAPVLQYTFHYNFQVASFLKERQSSLFSWLMPYPEDWSFWHGDTCLLATCSHEQMLEIAPEVAVFLEDK